LGLEDKIVGVTTYCQRPPDARSKEKIGMIREVNLERIVSLNPDLVVATSLVNVKAIEKLNNLGIKVMSFPPAKNFAEICKQFLKLGRFVGKEKEAEEIVRQAKTRVNVVKEKGNASPKLKVFIQIGAKPLFTVTEDSFINDFVEFAGGVNIAEDAKAGLYSREEVLRKNPDVIIIVTMGIVGEREEKIWQRFEVLNAVRNNKIYVVDSSRFCSPTPVTFAETLEELSRLIH